MEAAVSQAQLCQAGLAQWPEAVMLCCQEPVCAKSEKVGLVRWGGSWGRDELQQLWGGEHASSLAS